MTSIPILQNQPATANECEGKTEADHLLRFSPFAFAAIGSVVKSGLIASYERFVISILSIVPQRVNEKACDDLRAFLKVDSLVRGDDG